MTKTLKTITFLALFQSVLSLTYGSAPELKRCGAFIDLNTGRHAAQKRAHEDAHSDGEEPAKRSKQVVDGYDQYVKEQYNFCFNVYVPMKAATTDQGWKIHISATEESARKVAEVFFPFLKEKDSPYSYKISGCKRFYQNICQSPQKGKFITVYPQDDEEAKALAIKFDQMIRDANLTEDDFYPVRGDFALGGTGGIFTRYGPFREEYLLYDGKTYDDIRGEKPFPFFIEEHPFGDLIKQEDWHAETKTRESTPILP